MKQNSLGKIIANTIYIIGMLFVLFLGAIFLFGPKEAINPEAMLPWSRSEQAFILLATGSVPMMISCVSVYMRDDMKNSVHKKRNFILIFLPGFICAACALFIIGVIAVSMTGFIIDRILGRW